MARTYQPRPSSRQSQTAPQEAATGRTTRSTRSVSRDVSEQPSPQRGRGRPKGGGVGPQNKGARGVMAKDAVDLATVDEDAANEEQPQTEEAFANEEVVPENPRKIRHSSAHSLMSGTTAKTSFSQEEISDLDAEVMVDVLPSLATAADELAKLLVPADPKFRPVVRKEIRTAGTKHSKLYSNRVDAINVHKHSFGSTPYIQPSIVLRALLDVQNMKDVPQGTWRPDAIIYKINLTQMLRGLLIMQTGSFGVDANASGYNEMELLDVNFAGAIAGRDFRENAFQLCLSFLTQLAILRLTVYGTDPNFVPTSSIKRTFFTPDEDGEFAFRHRKILFMMDLPPEEQALLTAALNDLANNMITKLDDNNPATWKPAIGALRAEYPWEAFVDHAIGYYTERKQELDEEIAAAGGIDQIMLQLSDEVQRSQDARIAEQKRQSFSRPGGTPKKGFGKGGIRALKAREKQLAANAMPAPATAPVAPMTDPALAQAQQPAATTPAHDEWQTLGDDGAIIPPPQTVAQSTARSTLEAMSSFQDMQRQAARKGKGRSFVDRQEGAQRVAFDESQLTHYTVPAEFQYPASSAPEQGPYYQSPRGNGAKRPHQAIEDEEEPEEFEPTQDQGFEIDTRDTAAADQRRRQLPRPPRASQPRFSTLANNTAGPSAAPAFPNQSPSKRQRKNPGTLIPPASAPYPAGFDEVEEQYEDLPKELRMQRAKIAARHATVSATQRKPAQVRTPWSDEEENALIDLIEEEGGEGISYSKLKSHDEHNPDGPVLHRRSAEDLRFKARNMKETLLKGGSVLPQNFQFIVLDRKAIVKLHSLRIPYEQGRIRGGVVDFQE